MDLQHTVRSMLTLLCVRVEFFGNTHFWLTNTLLHAGALDSSMIVV